MNEEEIQHILKFKTQWWNELRDVQKAEKGTRIIRQVMHYDRTDVRSAKLTSLCYIISI